ncbi:T9SS type A sorting domain-containing protein [Hymenobacter algoricola]|uniref:T9SS type A sorting domain-containing protein n=1 Tax=Hymenobacter algoricola TaxID=486267 RepID=A0ABP7MKU3_9BACT
MDTGIVQLCRGTNEASEVVAELRVEVSVGGNCDGRIFYNGQGNVSLGWNITGDVYLCPTTAQNTELHKFEFNRSCVGKLSATDTRPRYLWTIKYKLASGGEYQEQWQNPGENNQQAEILLRLYDVVPRTRYQAINRGYIPWNYNPLAPVLTNGNAGEVITGARIEVTGYSCGTWLALCGQVSKTINVYYYPSTPATPSVSGSGIRCRTQTYTVSVPDVPQATRYAWSATGGATVSGTGSTATLNLSTTGPNVSNVEVRVVAYQDNAPCRKNSDVSAPANIALALAPAPAAPRNLQLQADLCPSLQSKPVTVEPVSGATNYRWTVTGAGAKIGTNSTTETITNTNSTLAYLPQNGQVTLTSQAITACGGTGAAATQTFTVGSTALPACPTSLLADYQCDGTDLFRVSVPNPAFGIQYNFSVRNIQPGNVQVVVMSTTRNSVSYLFSGGVPTRFDVRLLLNGCADFDVCGPFTVTPNPVISCRGRARAATGADPGSADRLPPATAQLSPNPTSGEVRIASTGSQQFVRAELTNARGTLVLTRKATSKEAGIHSLDLRALPAGLYTLRLYDGQTWSSQRIIKE